MLCLLSRRRRTQKTETVNDNYFTVDNYDTQQVTGKFKFYFDMRWIKVLGIRQIYYDLTH